MGDDISDLEAGSIYTRHAAATAAAVAAVGPADAAMLPDAEFARQWMMGLASERTWGRPRE